MKILIDLDTVNSHDKEILEKFLRNEQLDRIECTLDRILKGEQKIMAVLDDLETQVSANTDVEASAVLLLTQLHDLLVAAGTDPVKLQALTTKLATSKDSLAAAIVANTPAAKV